MRQDLTKAKGQATPKKATTDGAPAGRAQRPVHAPKTPRVADVSKREVLNLRVKHQDRVLIDRAARLSGRSRTDFLLEAGRRAATDTLLDQTFFQTDGSTFAALSARLDAPPQPSEPLKRMLQTPAPWDA